MLDPDESQLSGMERLAVSSVSPGVSQAMLLQTRGMRAVRLTEQWLFTQEEGDEETELPTARIEVPLGDVTDEAWQQSEAACRSPAVPIRSSGRQRTDELDELDESVLQEMLMK